MFYPTSMDGVSSLGPSIEEVGANEPGTALVRQGGGNGEVAPPPLPLFGYYMEPDGCVCSFSFYH